MTTFVPHDCPLCQNTRHHRTRDGRLVRCSCVEALLDEAFIKADLRGTSSECTWAGDPLPFEDTVRFSDPDTFDGYRHLVWRSLLTLRPAHPHLRYDFLDAYRLMTVHFERDLLYTTSEEIVALDLVAFYLGVTYVRNSFFSDLFGYVLQQRRTHGAPTWIWTPMSATDIRASYGPDVLHALRVEAEPPLQSPLVVETTVGLVPPRRSSKPNRQRERAG